MPELRVCFDPLNPAQFYACCGLVELFDLAGAETLSLFEVDPHRAHHAELVITSASGLDLALIVNAIKGADFFPATRRSADKPPDKDLIAPVSVRILDKDLVLDWWLDEFHDQATSLKCWAGQVTSRKLFAELSKLLPAGNASFDADGFTSTRFGLDPRSAWVALDLGYSPNEQDQESRTYPAVEMLAAFGLQGFRPAGNRAQGFRYSLWCQPLPRIVARAVSAQPWAGLEAAQYEFKLGKRGSYKFFCFAKPTSV